MRLTDELELSPPSGSPLVLRCYMGHEGGTDMYEGSTVERPFYYAENAAALVQLPDNELPALAENPNGYTATHKGLEYRVTDVRPRYRPGGRLHHVTLGLRRVEG